MRTSVWTENKYFLLCPSKKIFFRLFSRSQESPTNQPGGETPFQDDAAKMEWLSFAPSGASKNVAEQ